MDNTAVSISTAAAVCAPKTNPPRYTPGLSARDAPSSTRFGDTDTRDAIFCPLFHSPRQNLLTATTAVR